MQHDVKFERNTRTGDWRAMCSGCYWVMVGPSDEVQKQAAVHDMIWEAVEVDCPPIALKGGP
jgi:hypothetical protein